MARKKGSSNDDKMHGGRGHDVLKGHGGDDRLKGGAGNDVLNGGAGIDTADMSGSDSVTVDLNLKRAQYNGRHGADKFVSIENVIGGSRNDRLVGNDEANTLDGANGNDRLEGRGGNDVLLGGKGNDRLLGGTGNDRLDDGHGNDRADGGDGDDTIVVGHGNDDLRGGNGIDTLIFGDKAATFNLSVTKAQKTGWGVDKISGFENVTGGAGNDAFTGDKAANTLDGAAGNDTLDGGDGDDILLGGAGIDNLTGGKGIDTFRFAALSDLGSTVETADVVLDFELGVDKLDLSLIDADAATEGRQAFLAADFSVDSGAPAFTKAGQLYFDKDAGVLYGNVNADTAADFVIKLGPNLANLAPGDFVL